MGMTIEEIKNELRSDLTIKRITGNDYSESLKDCLTQLLVIAEKYQKIEKIINAPIGGTSARYNAIVNLIKYSEIENRNDKKKE